MTRLYRNRGVWLRSGGLAAVLVLVFLWGAWELWSAAHGSADNATSGAMFGVIFLAGGVFAMYQLIGDYRDLVVTLDRDEASGALTATLWQPTGPLKVAAAKGELANWRRQVKVINRNARSFFLYADSPRHSRPLRFELRKDTDLSGLRQIAPEAVNEAEPAIGTPGA